MKSYAAALLLIAAPLLHAEATPAAALLALSKGDLTLAIVDPATQKVIARMPSGPDPHEVIASDDGKFAYISNYGGGAYNTITVVDLIAQKTVNTIDLGALRGPHGLAYSGGKLWFTAEGAKAIGSYDPATQKIDWILGTGQNRTHMVWITEDQKRLVTSNISSATMTVIEKRTSPGRGGRGTQTDWDETVIPVGRGAEGFDVSPDGKEIWAANAQDGTVSILDFNAKKPLVTLDANVSGANRLKFTLDGKLVLVSTFERAGPDRDRRGVAPRREAHPDRPRRCRHPERPDGEVAYIGCTPDNYIAIVNLKTLEVTGHIDAGKQPDGLAWAVRR